MLRQYGTALTLAANSCVDRNNYSSCIGSVYLYQVYGIYFRGENKENDSVRYYLYENLLHIIITVNMEKIWGRNGYEDKREAEISE